MGALFFVLAAVLAMAWFVSCSMAAVNVYRDPGSGVDRWAPIGLLCLAGALVCIFLSGYAGDRKKKRMRGREGDEDDEKSVSFEA